MKRLALLVALAAALAAGAASAAPQSGRFVVVFAPPHNADEKILVSLLEQAQMPLVFSELSQHMKLTRNITISVQGGNAGPYYNPKTSTIVLNHSFSALALNYWFKKYPKAKPYDIGYRFAELVYFVLFHEVGHALVDQWDIPVLGREEDAVDAFSTIFMTEIVKRGDFALAGAEFFLDVDKLTGAAGHLNFADEHSFNKQRAYSIACWVYGSDPVKWSQTNLKTFLPPARRVRCADEYRKLKKSWFGLLKPHLR